MKNMRVKTSNMLLEYLTGHACETCASNTFAMILGNPKIFIHRYNHRSVTFFTFQFLKNYLAIFAHLLNEDLGFRSVNDTAQVMVKH